MPAIHHAVFSVPRYPLPINVTLPVISGTPRVGELLSASTGSWFGDPSTFNYVWYRGSQSVATGSTYTLTTSDISATMTVRVRAGNVFGYTIAISAPTGVVSPASTPTGDVLLLESGDRLLKEDSFYFLLEQQATSTGNSLLLEIGDEILLETGDRLLLDQVESPTDALLDVSASYMLDVSGDYLREVP